MPETETTSAIYGPPPCPNAAGCLRGDGICCPDYACDIESGVYTGPVLRPWWEDVAAPEQVGPLVKNG